MKRPTRLWYGGPLGESLAIVLPALPFGLGIGHFTGRYLQCLLAALAVSFSTYAFLKLDLAFIHPRWRGLPPRRAVLLETITGLGEHFLGAALGLGLARWVFGPFLPTGLMWLLAGGTLVTQMVMHAVSYTLYSHSYMKERILQEERLRAIATEAELKALKAQINPHFLFNTLNTIAALIHSDPDAADATVQRLAEMFRYVLAQGERAQVTLGEELDFVDGYLSIEKARFGERLHVDRYVADDGLQTLVPSLILQPLVENAVRHGASADGSIHLLIRVQPDGDDVVVSIEDNGPGMLAESLTMARSGLGLPNVQERLVKTYGEKYGLQIEPNKPVGAVVGFRVPMKQE